MADDVTQADREAAAKVRPYSYNSTLILDGERDGTDIVQAAKFARLASTEALRAELAEAKAEIARLREAGQPLVRAVQDTRDLDQYTPLAAGRRACNNAITSFDLETLAEALAKLSEPRS